MRPVQHHSNNSVLRPPPGTRAEECKPLPVTRAPLENGMPSVRSYWQPSQAERAAIAAGAAVCLSSWGTTHPPVHLTVDGVDEG